MSKKDARDLFVILSFIAALAYGATLEMTQTCDGIRPNVTYCKVAEAK